MLMDQGLFAPQSGSLAMQCVGRGAGVLCLHSSAGGWQQWRSVMQQLQGEMSLQAPDLLGHGASPAWPVDAPASLAFEACAVLASLRGGHAPLDLVGHSYGGALALQIALQRPRLVRSLTLYEPVAFGLLDSSDPAWLEIRGVARQLDSCLAEGNTVAAAQGFVNYWHGGDAWSGLKPSQREPLARRMPVVSRHFKALFNARWNAQVLSQLRMPVHLICGGRTRLPAARVATLLSRCLPQASLQVLPEAGHMGPLTHAAQVAEMMAAALLQGQPCALAA